MVNKRVIEILLGVILVVLVFIMILIGIGFENKTEIKNTQVNAQKTIVSNSYNTYNNYNTHNSYVVKNYEKKIVKQDFHKKRNCEYDSYGKHEKDYLFGTYANTYRVYVKNNGESDYFKVKFYFKNKFGKWESKTIRKHVFSDEEEMFYYRDISKDKTEYYFWKYEVIHN